MREGFISRELLASCTVPFVPMWKFIHNIHNMNSILCTMELCKRMALYVSSECADETIAQYMGVLKLILHSIWVF